MVFHVKRNKTRYATLTLEVHFTYPYYLSLSLQITNNNDIGTPYKIRVPAENLSSSMSHTLERIPLKCPINNYVPKLG